MTNIPDEPSIAKVLREGETSSAPTCPICGEVCHTYYIDCYSEVVGCNKCIGTADAYEYEED